MPTWWARYQRQWELMVRYLPADDAWYCSVSMPGIRGTYAEDSVRGAVDDPGPAQERAQQLADSQRQGRTATTPAERRASAAGR